MASIDDYTKPILIWSLPVSSWSWTQHSNTNMYWEQYMLVHPRTVLAAPNFAGNLETCIWWMCDNLWFLVPKSGDLYVMNVWQPVVPGLKIWRPLCDEYAATRGSWSQNLETFMWWMCSNPWLLVPKSGDLYVVNVRQPMVPGPEIWRPLFGECAATHSSWSQNLETFMRLMCGNPWFLVPKSGDLYLMNVRQPMVHGPVIWRLLCDECAATRGSWSRNLNTFMQWMCGNPWLLVQKSEDLYVVDVWQPFVQGPEI